MPIGLQRINDPHPQPSSQIVFIKPLPGPDEKYAKDFLERIAAICHPIMKANHLSIMTLEEHVANREFVGRNFNAGEIIQLVLKSQATGQWLSFKTVQMVMMHEIAHCSQMNHSRNFWKIRNQYVEELRQLWQKNYTGDGLWGKGQTLLSGAYDTGRNAENDVLPEHLCGGAYRSSRRRKRRANASNEKIKSETYAEKKQRRITKKFGTGGQLLGSDLDQRVKLEYGQVNQAKPRVASSARGRELRFAAVLARLEAQKGENSDLTDPLDAAAKDELDSITEDEYEKTGDDNDILDNGKAMVKVCEDDDATDVNVKQEMDEIQRLAGNPELPSRLREDVETTDEEGPDGNDERQSRTKGPSALARRISSIDQDAETTAEEGTNVNTHNHLDTAETTKLPGISAGERQHMLPTSTTTEMNCPICSMTNELDTLRCTACLHVLNTTKIVNSWRCQSKECSTDYINAGDCNLCGVCGIRKPGLGAS